MPMLIKFYKKRWMWVFLLLLTFIFSVLPFVLPKKRFQLYPNPNIYSFTFDDRDTRASARGEVLSQGPLSWVCDYHTVGDSMVCGLELLWPDQMGGLLDLSEFDTAIVHLDFKGKDEYIVLWMVTYEVFSGHNDGKPMRKNMEKALRKDVLGKPVAFSLDDFSPSPWWLKDNNISPSADIFKRDKVKIIQFAIERPNQTQKNYYTLHSFVFEGSYLKPMPVFSALTVLWVSGITFIFLRRRALRRARQLEEQQSKLEQARIRAENANQEKNRFLATASHDLRQPLHNMGFLIENLAYSADKPLSLQTVSAFEHSHNYLTRLLDSLLDLSRIELGMIKAEARHFSAVQLFSDLQVNYGHSAQEQDLVLVFSGLENFEGSLYTDYDSLYRIVGNYLSNAIKYTDVGSVRVSLSREADSVWIHVSDSGQGFSDSEKQKLFEAFYQIDNQSRTQNRGLGLGLHIARRLSEMLNLELDVNSTPGVGSRFSVKVPFSYKVVALNETTKGEPASVVILKGKKVLLIENEVDIQKSMQRILQRWGLEVALVANRQEFEASGLGQENFDLIVSDFMLSETESGAQLIEAYRVGNKHTAPAILMTGSSAVYGEQINTDLWETILHKPVKPQALFQVMIEVLGRAQGKSLG